MSCVIIKAQPKVVSKVTNKMPLWGAEIKMHLGIFLIHLTNKASAYTNHKVEF